MTDYIWQKKIKWNGYEFSKRVPARPSGENRLEDRKRRKRRDKKFEYKVEKKAENLLATFGLNYDFFYQKGCIWSNFDNVRKVAEKYAVYRGISVRTLYVLEDQGKSQRTKPECRVNIMQKFSSYLTENRVRFYCNYERPNNVHKSTGRLSLESYRKHKYTEYSWRYTELPLYRRELNAFVMMSSVLLRSQRCHAQFPALFGQLEGPWGSVRGN